MAQHIILYMPSYHKGYAEFFAIFPDAQIHIMSLGLAENVFPQIVRDVRAASADDLSKMLTSLGRNVQVLSEAGAKNPALKGRLIMPDEDISHLFAKAYLKGKDVEFVPMHLRWDGWSSTKESSVRADGTVTHDKMHANIMRQAQTEAAKSPDWWRQVGAAIAKDGKIILLGHNRPHPDDGYKLNAYGDPRSNFDAGVSYDLATAEHGEAYLIGLAARSGIALKGCDMYVTTFPCPTCAKLIATAGIKAVYFDEGYSLVDANELFESAGIKIIQVKD